MKMTNSGDDKESVEVEEAEKSGDDSGSDDCEYEIEEILNVKAFVKENVLKYKIRWVGYSEDYDSWEPEENLLGAEDALKSFKQTHAAEVDKALKTLGRNNKQAKKTNAKKVTKEKPTSKSKEKQEILQLKPAEKVLRGKEEDADIVDSDDEEIIISRKRPADQRSNVSASSTRNNKKPRLEFSPRKLCNSWMYKDLDEDTEDDENIKCDKKNVIGSREKANTDNEEIILKNEEKISANGEKIIIESEEKTNGSDEKQCAHNSDRTIKSDTIEIPATSSSKEAEKVGFGQMLDGEGSKFTACFQRPDGSIHMLRSCGEVKCLMPIKDAHERYGFEVVEYLLCHADFK
uniref:Chromo domain-containing protein n=1 Tax=Syphacia muris TaxID=451379 RepID=A0A0N5ARI0_9BILA